MEQGPITTSRRSSLPCMMSRMARRVRVISASTGVPWIGKKRIRCSGGGSTVMSLMRWSSVWLVLSTGCAYQASEAAVALAFMDGCLLLEGFSRGQEKTAGGAGGWFEVLCVCLGYAQISLPPGALENQK